MGLVLRDVLRECAELAARYRARGQHIGEQNTKASLIEPVIEALGWDLRDLDEVHREYRFEPSTNPVDYALLLARKPKLFIEAKGLAEDLDQSKWLHQVLTYAISAGVTWVVLTNGEQWRVYNAHAPVPAGRKLFRAVDVAADVEAAAEVLALLSKEAMAADRARDLWQAEHVGRHLRAALADLFAGTVPSAELVALVRQRAPELSEAEIRDGLLRTRATFDFPAPEPGSGKPHAVTPASTPAAVRPPAKPAAASPAPTIGPAAAPSVAPAPGPVGPAVASGSATSRVPALANGSRRVTAAEKSLSLLDLITAGVVSVGSDLVADYRGQRRTAKVLADGQVTYAGKAKTLSRAGSDMKKEIAGPNLSESTASTDGWEFWKATHPASGQLVKLRDLRRELASLPSR